AEDGIRDFHVTGVQTCALPIFRGAPTWADIQPGRQDGSGQVAAEHQRSRILGCLARNIAVTVLVGSVRIVTLAAADRAESGSLKIGRASCRERGGGGEVRGDVT